MTEGPDLLIDGSAGASTIVLAHGAGAPMDSPFMQRIAIDLAGRGFRVVRFEFDYMHARRAGAGRRPPDRAPRLRERWLQVLERVGNAAELVIGGKSMGGRIASMLADEVGARGLVLLGYPFHPPGRPERLRTAHLAGLQTPTLIVQGTRDALGSRDEIAGYELSPQIRLAFIEDGDHSLKPRVRSGHTLDESLERAVAEIADFVRALEA